MKSSLILKNREDDFLQEVKYVNNCVQNNIKENDISFSKGLKTFSMDRKVLF